MKSTIQDVRGSDNLEIQKLLQPLSLGLGWGLGLSWAIDFFSRNEKVTFKLIFSLILVFVFS